MNYNKEYFDIAYHQFKNKDFYNATTKLGMDILKDVPKDSKILDFGGGIGQNIIGFKNGLCYDVSEYALQECRNRGIKTISYLNNIEDNVFDIIISFHVLEHVFNPYDELRKMNRVLKKGGKLILVIPIEKFNTGKNDFNLCSDKHLYQWNWKCINNLLLMSGFQPIENSLVRRKGQGLLIPIFKISQTLYVYLTKLMGYIGHCNEMKIVAVK